MTLKPAELNIPIFPFHRHGDDILVAPFIQHDYTEVGGGGYRKYFLKYTKFTWKQAFVSSFYLKKKVGEMRIKGLRPGEILSQDRKDVDCTVSERSVWRKNSMVEGSRHDMNFCFG